MGRGTGQATVAQGAVTRASVHASAYRRASVDEAADYDERLRLAYAITKKPLPGAVRQPLLALSELAEIIAQEPGAAVVISDVHASVDRLKDVLGKLGVTDEAGARVPGRGRLIQIGDLVDGRDRRDAETLAYGSEVFDVLLAGNHEAALLGGKPFGGLFSPDPDVRRGLDGLMRQGRVDAAVVAHGVLISHAGVNKHLFEDDDPDRLAEAINEDFVHFYYRNSHQPATLFDHTAHRGRGGRAEHGGVLWQDFSQLVQADQHHDDLRQLTGHSVLGGVEADPEAQVFCIDTQGPRLGVAVIRPDGQMLFGSDVIPSEADLAEAEALVKEHEAAEAERPAS